MSSYKFPSIFWWQQKGCIQSATDKTTTNNYPFSHRVDSRQVTWSDCDKYYVFLSTQLVVEKFTTLFFKKWFMNLHSVWWSALLKYFQNRNIYVEWTSALHCLNALGWYTWKLNVISQGTFLIIWDVVEEAKWGCCKNKSIERDYGSRLMKVFPCSDESFGDPNEKRDKLCLGSRHRWEHDNWQTLRRGRRKLESLGWFRMVCITCSNFMTEVEFSYFPPSGRYGQKRVVSTCPCVWPRLHQWPMMLSSSQRVPFPLSSSPSPSGVLASFFLGWVHACRFPCGFHLHPSCCCPAWWWNHPPNTAGHWSHSSRSS